ncbi:unnamed protein product [Musa acuminata subsp. burmannicoides]
MDPRLEEAAYAGDLTLFRRLLQEDRLLLHRQAIAAAHLSDSPLHIAASLGHSDLVRDPHRKPGARAWPQPRRPFRLAPGRCPRPLTCGEKSCCSTQPLPDSTW